MYNKVILIGRIVATPELHKTNNDKSVARATIAINRRFKDQNGEREADFINIVFVQFWCCHDSSNKNNFIVHFSSSYLSIRRKSKKVTNLVTFFVFFRIIK